MDKKEKKFKINIVDFIVVLVVIAVVAAAALILKPRLFAGGTVAETETKIITIELAKQKQYMTENIVVGEMAYDAIGNTNYGKVVSYDIKPATETVVSKTDGSVKTANIPERYDIYVNFEASADSTAEVGKLATIYTKSFKASGYVIGINKNSGTNEAAIENVESKEAVQQ